MKYESLSLLIILSGFIMYGCQSNVQSTEWKEVQVTSREYGHFLNPTQAWSPDSRWIAYDSRNVDSQIGRTGRIERVNLKTNQIDTVYRTTNQSLHGPGVGAVAYSPVNDQVIFIHGVQNANKERPYGISRRTGMGVFMGRTSKVVHYDARDIYPPFTIGALRGGTHAHSWSGDGSWISFTYNDDVMAELSKKDTSVEDLRMVGVMAPWGRVHVPQDTIQENNDGALFAMVISRVTEHPSPGSDEISKAYEDGWIGKQGYVDGSGTRHPKAVAFLGDVRDENGKKVTEVFVVDLPENRPETLIFSGTVFTGKPQLKGTDKTRPQPLSMVHQRRVTYTTKRKFPGVQGPRQWMKSSPDGSQLYFMMKDDRGTVQIYSVPTIGGDIEQITENDFSIETSFDVDPSGKWVAYGADQKVYLTGLETGDTNCITPKISDNYSDLRAIQWSPSGRQLTHNRKVLNADTAYYQIFTLSENE